LSGMNQSASSFSKACASPRRFRKGHAAAVGRARPAVYRRLLKAPRSGFQGIACNGISKLARARPVASGLSVQMLENSVAVSCGHLPPPHSHRLLTAGLPSASRRSLTGWPCRNICTSLSQRVSGRCLGQFAVHAAAGDGGNWGCSVVDRSIQAQIPAPGAGNVKLADVGKFGIERFNNGQGFVIVQLEGAGVGEDDAFLVEAQVHRVGAQPVAAAGVVVAFAEQAQGAEGRVGLRPKQSASAVSNGWRGWRSQAAWASSHSKPGALSLPRVNWSAGSGQISSGTSRVRRTGAVSCWGGEGRRVYHSVFSRPTPPAWLCPTNC
jgi:hypothetical protein